MLESNVIQYRGFHNIEKDGEITGFQVCVRSDYYRGVWLSQLRPGKVVVDGVTYPKESVIWEINGRDYTIEELAEWQMPCRRRSALAHLFGLHPETIPESVL